MIRHVRDQDSVQASPSFAVKRNGGQLICCWEIDNCLSLVASNYGEIGAMAPAAQEAQSLCAGERPFPCEDPEFEKATGVR